MWYKIKQGKHRASPLSLGIHTGKTSESYEVIFDDSCRYLLEGVDQWDWNKLVGWSYGMHHTNSIRIGWRYNRESDKIELALYTYDSGIRRESYLGEVNIGTKYYIELKYYSGIVDAYVRNSDINVQERSLSTYQDTFMIPKWGYNLSLFFGGNKSQPNKQTMKIWIKKLKKH